VRVPPTGERPRCRGGEPPLIVALSGADGSGKSTVAAALAARLEAEGHAVVSVYTYGCVVCRRVPRPLRLTVAGGRRIGGRPQAEPLLRILNGMHAVVDAAELRVRLWAAVRAAHRARAGQAHRRRISRDGNAGPRPGVHVAGEASSAIPARPCPPRPVVVAERSPLDGLVKYDPAPGTVASRALRGAASAYAMVVWLDAPAALLVERDHEHEVVVLQVLASRFARFASTLPRVLRADAAAPVADVVSTIADRVAALSTAPCGTDRPPR
jgi:hypothetical protein